MVRTGQGAMRITRSATLPITRCLEASAAMGRHDDEVDFLGLGDLDNLVNTGCRPLPGTSHQPSDRLGLRQELG